MSPNYQAMLARQIFAYSFVDNSRYIMNIFSIIGSIWMKNSRRTENKQKTIDSSGLFVELIICLRCHSEDISDRTEVLTFLTFTLLCTIHTSPAFFTFEIFPPLIAFSCRRFYCGGKCSPVLRRSIPPRPVSACPVRFSHSPSVRQLTSYSSPTTVVCFSASGAKARAPRDADAYWRLVHSSLCCARESRASSVDWNSSVVSYVLTSFCWTDRTEINYSPGTHRGGDGGYGFFWTSVGEDWRHVFPRYPRTPPIPWSELRWGPAIWWSSDSQSYWPSRGARWGMRGRMHASSVLWNSSSSNNMAWSRSGMWIVPALSRGPCCWSHEGFPRARSWFC